MILKLSPLSRQTFGRDLHPRQNWPFKLRPIPKFGCIALGYRSLVASAELSSHNKLNTEYQVEGVASWKRVGVVLTLVGGACLGAALWLQVLALRSVRQGGRLYALTVLPFSACGSEGVGGTKSCQPYG
jgi:hypothetical protein